MSEFSRVSRARIKRAIKRPASLGLAYILFGYLVIGSIPLILGVTYEENPDVIRYWQYVSLGAIGIATLIYSFIYKSAGVKYIWFLLSLMIVKILTIVFLIVDGSTSVTPSIVFAEMLGTPIFILIFLWLILLARAKLAPDALRILLKLFVSFAIFAAVYNISLNYQDILAFTGITNAYDFDFKSFFENRNGYSFFVAFAMISLMYLYHTRKTNWRLLYFTSMLFLGINLILTLSRGGIILFLLSATAFILLTGTFKKIFVAAILASVVVLSTLAFLGTEFIEANLVRSDSGLTHRDDVQAISIDHFLSNNIFFGTGEIAREVVERKYDFNSFHSFYVDTLVTSGIAGFVLYLLYFVVLFRTSLRIRRKNKELGSFLIAVMVAFLAYITIESARPFGMSSTSPLVTIFIYLLPIYVWNYYRESSSVRNEAVK